MQLDAVDTANIASLPRYDAVLVSLGYESRASFIASKLRLDAPILTACSFTSRHVLSFDRNSRILYDLDYKIENPEDSALQDWNEAWVNRILSESPDSSQICIAVDISSMSRIRMASLVRAIMIAKSTRDVCVDFFYAFSAWKEPEMEPEPIVTAGPVLPYFAGWSSEPDWPSTAIIGLGYEPDKAVGSCEYLEASQVWVFIPQGADPRFADSVLRANKSLLKVLPESRVIKYRLSQPVNCFRLLESIVYGASVKHRPVLLPFGPKLFAICALLVSCLHQDVPVWRISSEQSGTPSDSLASGDISSMRCLFKPSLPES
jgi:hypothetical protein